MLIFNYPLITILLAVQTVSMTSIYFIFLFYTKHAVHFECKPSNKKLVDTKFVNHFMGKVYLYCRHFTCIPFNSVFKYGTFKSTINMGDTIFVTHALKTFYRVWSSPDAWGKTVKNGVRCSAPVQFFLFYVSYIKTETKLMKVSV